MTRKDLILPGYHVNIRARCQAHDAQVLNARCGIAQPERGHCIARVITTRLHPIARLHRALL